MNHRLNEARLNLETAKENLTNVASRRQALTAALLRANTDLERAHFALAAAQNEMNEAIDEHRNGQTG